MNKTRQLELYYNIKDQGMAGGDNPAITTLTDQIGNADGTLQGFSPFRERRAIPSLVQSSGSPLKDRYAKEAATLSTARS